MPGDSQKVKDAKAAMEAALDAAKKTGPEAVSVAAAGRAAAAAIPPPNSHRISKARPLSSNAAARAGKAAEELQTAVRAAKDAAEATNEAVKLVTSAGRERDAASDGSAATKIEKVDLTVCSVAANSAAAAASAAARSADATAAGNTRAAQSTPP